MKETKFNIRDRVIYKSVGEPLSFQFLDGVEGVVTDPSWINPDGIEFVRVDFPMLSEMVCYESELTKVEDSEDSEVS